MHRRSNGGRGSAWHCPAPPCAIPRAFQRPYRACEQCFKRMNGRKVPRINLPLRQPISLSGYMASLLASRTGRPHPPQSAAQVRHIRRCGSSSPRHQHARLAKIVGVKSKAGGFRAGIAERNSVLRAGRKEALLPKTQRPSHCRRRDVRSSGIRVKIRRARDCHQPTEPEASRCGRRQGAADCLRAAAAAPRSAG